jgi:cobaltochelatase CobS
MEKITCQICGEKVHVIKTHLAKMSDEAHSLTLEEYSEQYPDAPTISDFARQEVQKRMAAKTALAEPEEVATPDNKIELHKAYRLRNSKKTQYGNGQPIMLTRDERETDANVPDFDELIISDLEEVKTVAMGMERNIPIYIYGEAGVGKTTEYRQFCAATNRRLRRLQHTANLEESQIVGRQIARAERDEGGNAISVTDFELGPLPLAMINGEVFLADEYDRCHPSVLSVYQAVLEGQPLIIPDAPPQYQRIDPHPMFRFVATGNTNGSGDGGERFQSTFQQDAATIERFGVVMKKGYLAESQEITMLNLAVGLEEKDAKSLIAIAKKVRENPDEYSLTIGNRVLIRIAQIGVMKGSFVKGFELAYANRLPSDERDAVMKYVQIQLGN